MFWSPNYDSNPSSNLNGWWPGANYVDIVGMDVYPSAGSSFEDVYGAFYSAFATRYNKHFAIGETGGANGGTGPPKEQWATHRANTHDSAYPCYKSATWFEFYKGEDDFRIIQEQSAATIKETLSNFA